MIVIVPSSAPQSVTSVVATSFTTGASGDCNSTTLVQATVQVSPWLRARILNVPFGKFVKVELVVQFNPPSILYSITAAPLASLPAVAVISIEPLSVSQSVGLAATTSVMFGVCGVINSIFGVNVSSQVPSALRAITVYVFPTKLMNTFDVCHVVPPFTEYSKASEPSAVTVIVPSASLQSVGCVNVAAKLVTGVGAMISSGG